MPNSCNCTNCELRSAFFESFKEVQQSIICDEKIEVAYSPSQTVFKVGDTVKYFFYLKSGLVKLFKTDREGNDQIITIASPFDFVSLLGVFSETHHSYSVSAIEDSVVCCIGIDRMKSIAQQNSLFSMNLMERLGAISNKIIQESLEIRKRNAHGKVAYILLKFSEEIYQNSVFNLPLSRREIAEYIGITTESVIRIFSEFRKEKLIRINGKEIEILNEETLEKISKYG